MGLEPEIKFNFYSKNKNSLPNFVFFFIREWRDARGNTREFWWVLLCFGNFQDTLPHMGCREAAGVSARMNVTWGAQQWAQGDAPLLRWSITTWLCFVFARRPESICAHEPALIGIRKDDTPQRARLIGILQGIFILFLFNTEISSLKMISVCN